MLKPDLQKAKIRTNEEVLTKSFKYTELDNLKELGKGKKYFIRTYGCQMNEHDTENIKAILEGMSYVETDDYEEANLILLNTCAIRENVHNKVFGMLGRIKNLKERKNDVIAGVCGCMAQEEVVVNEILDKYNYLDLVFGTHNIANLPNILSRAISKKEIEVEVISGEGSVLENIPVKRDNKYKAWVNIMFGCDKFCTYCIVPYTRGKQRSRNKDNIIKEVEELVQKGYKEVTLLGQNVNAYGKDLDTNYGLSDLLKDVSKTNIERIRFVTSHPWDFTDEMVDIIASHYNIMPYIHLPVQSGSTKILNAMGRKYSREEYLTLFNKLKNKVSNASITTDIIVGFPGETDEDFEETLALVEECKFDSAFTFAFSARVGTPAAKMKNDVSDEVKKERLNKLNEVVNKHAKMNNDKYLNKKVKVLIEKESNKDGFLSGYTDTMKLVNVEASKELLGSIVDVIITDVKTWSLTGELIN